MDKCQLEDWKQCCCTCEWQYVDRSHPATDGKKSYITKGYICAIPYMGCYSGWDEHGLCECWRKRPERPDTINAETGDKVWFEAEMWDARYAKRDHREVWRKLTDK